MYARGTQPHAVDGPRGLPFHMSAQQAAALEASYGLHRDGPSQMNQAKVCGLFPCAISRKFAVTALLALLQMKGTVAQRQVPPHPPPQPNILLNELPSPLPRLHAGLRPDPRPIRNFTNVSSSS